MIINMAWYGVFASSCCVNLLYKERLIQSSVDARNRDPEKQHRKRNGCYAGFGEGWWENLQQSSSSAPNEDLEDDLSANDSTGIRLTSFRLFEAGEGKSILDRHFASVRHAVVSNVRSGLIFDSGSAIEKVLKELSGVTVYSLFTERAATVTSRFKSFEAPIPSIAALHDWRYSYNESLQVRIEAYQCVSGPDGSGVLAYHRLVNLSLEQFNQSTDYAFVPAFVEGELRLELTKSVYRPSAEGENHKLLPPLVRTIYSAEGKLHD